ncbi:hypothetical protein NP493_46g01059 [Ridgeia piscesae]|uniref:Cleavage and polyadenylation specificity factor subunit 2 n=1 Tax=Ridgeia piscesae TaxID=27915 RepID=A0AAD9PBG0_RIDPI|nr:hypothetical protein NP493_46g01059 [Ridgeia piscesae]
MVVLASGPDMQCGFSRDLFIQWCSNPKNCVILTTRTSPGTLSRQLMDNPGLQKLKIEMKRRVRLEGAELEEYLRNEKTEATKARQKAEQAKKDKEELESSDESDNEMDTEVDKSGVVGAVQLLLSRPNTT